MNKIKNENIKCIIRCFLNCLIFWIYCILPYALLDGVNLDMGPSVLIGTTHLLISLGLIIPILSWRYAKKAIKCDKMRYVYCLCYALIFVLPYFAVGNKNIMFLVTPILFAWVLLWEMIPIIQFEVKSRKEMKEKDSADAS